MYMLALGLLTGSLGRWNRPMGWMENEDAMLTCGCVSHARSDGEDLKVPWEHMRLIR